MAQKLVTRRMTAGVVHQFELVQIQKHQRVPTLLSRQVLQHQFQAVFELTAVGQPGERIMGGLPGQIGDVLPLLGHVMQHQHRAAEFARVQDRRAGQGDRHGAAIHTLDKPGVFTVAAQLTAEHMINQLEAFIRPVVIKNFEQRPQRHTPGLFGLPVSQVLGSRVHVRDGTINIGTDHAISNGFQGDLRPLFFELQRFGKDAALNQNLVGAQQRQANQPQGHGQVNCHQQLQNKP